MVGLSSWSSPWLEEGGQVNQRCSMLSPGLSESIKTLQTSLDGDNELGGAFFSRETLRLQALHPWRVVCVYWEYVVGGGGHCFPPSAPALGEG